MADQSTPIMGWPQLGSFGAFLVMVAVMTVQAAARTLHYVRHGVPDHALPLTQASPKETPGA
jgi:hypothetical protein